MNFSSGFVKSGHVNSKVLTLCRRALDPKFCATRHHTSSVKHSRAAFSQQKVRGKRNTFFSVHVLVHPCEFYQFSIGLSMDLSSRITTLPGPFCEASEACVFDSAVCLSVCLLSVSLSHPFVLTLPPSIVPQQQNAMGFLRSIDFG